jgi:putative hydrolase of the HAD superfamily
LGGAGAVSVDAVVFDLYGTLVDEFQRALFFETLEAMADALGVSREPFRSEWEKTAIARQTGVYATVEDNVLAVCETLGAPAGDGSMSRAMALRAEMYDRSFRVKPAALETLRGIRERGLPIALVSMCAPDTPALWRATELAAFIDVEVFSCEVGLRKPDPAIYGAASDGLGVDPASCLYVGDGAYGELSGAAAIGMTAVLVRDPGEMPGEMLRPESEDGWEGPVISFLLEVLPLLDDPHAVEG